VALVVHVRCLTPHPVARREPGPAPSRVGGSPRAIPSGRRPSRDGRVASRERRVSPISATDSRNEHPLDGPIPGGVWCATLVELRLTANLQLWPSPRPSRAARGPRVGVTRGPGGAPIDGSSARYLPDAVLSSAYRARDVASGVLCRGPWRIRHRCRISFASGRSIWLRRRLVKDDAWGRIRTPSIAERSLPRARRHSRACAWDHEEPSPVTLLACSWLSPLRTGVRRCFTRRARTLSRGDRRARPGPSGLDQAPLVDFCNLTIREHGCVLA